MVRNLNKSRRGRLKFSITTLFLLTTIAALLAVWWQEKQEHSNTRHELSERASAHADLEAQLPMLQAQAAVSSLPDAYRLQTQGRFEEAIAVLKPRHEANGRYLGVSHPMAIEDLFYIGELYSLTDQPDAAESYLVAYIEHARVGFQTKARLAIALNYLGDVRRRQGRFTEAEPLLRECLAIKKQVQPSHWTVPNVVSLLGECLLHQGELAEAEPLLLEGYNGLQSRASEIWQPQWLPPQASQLPVAIRRLVMLYEEWDKPEEAEKWRQELNSEPL